jgi:hypothetical protein
VKKKNKEQLVKKIFKSVFAATATKQEPSEKKEKPKKPKEKKDKPVGKPKGKQKKVEPKKKGRPTNAERAEKARVKTQADIAFRKELLERQKAATVSGSIVQPIATGAGDVSADVDVNDPSWVPPWPVFLPGQRVETIFKRIDGKVEKGNVCRDDVKSAMIRVNWDDGSSQYAAKQALKIIVKKVYEKVSIKKAK